MVVKPIETDNFFMFDEIRKRYHNIENGIIIQKTKAVCSEYFCSIFILSLMHRHGKMSGTSTN
jgi:hypothetical protein